MGILRTSTSALRSLTSKERHHGSPQGRRMLAQLSQTMMKVDQVSIHPYFHKSLKILPPDDVLNISYTLKIQNIFFIPMHDCLNSSGMGILRIFPHLRIFSRCFQPSAFLRVSAISSFPHSNQRERERERERNARKNAHKKYP